MPCPNALHVIPSHLTHLRFRCFAVAFELSRRERDKWRDQAKFDRRARHVADPAFLRGAVPLLRKKSKRRYSS